MISKKSLRWNSAALFASAAVLLLAATPQFSVAQQPAQDDAQVGKPDEQAREVITVTGSRIGRKELESKVPLTVIPRAELDLQSSKTVVDLIKDLPEVAGNLLTTNISNGGGDGTSDITLRGLPSEETLVLLNGHRLPPSKFGSTPDVNAIPTGAIERVEILKDGASALYGSDAIAGVVNIITKKNFDGLAVSGDYGLATRSGHFPNRSFDIMLGKNSDKGNITAGFGYFKQDELMSRDRDISRYAAGQSSAPPWTLIGDLGETLGNGSMIQFPDYTAGDYKPFNGGSEQSGGDRFNFNALTTSILELERFSFWGSGHYALNDYVTATIDANFTTTESFWRRRRSFLSSNRRPSASRPTSSSCRTAWSTRCRGSGSTPIRRRGC